MTGPTILSRSAQALAGLGILASVITATGIPQGRAETPPAAEPAAASALASLAAPPPALNPPAGQVLVADFAASGVQVYQCTSAAWVFVEPAANLLGWAKGSSGPRTVIHFRGPSWESTNDGSLVEAKAKVNLPVTGSIPQLLLESTRNRGDGLFGHVSYIQRLATSGGAAPAGACTEGQTTGVPYRARYRFFAPATS
jgi:Protein of unknown function (DUF3455)